MPLPKPSDASVLSLFSLKGKVAAVTGGARGIGLECVRGLAEAGADVAMIYSTTADADAKASEIAVQTGRTVKAYQADVRDCANIASVIEKIVHEFGHLDVVVANAGVAAHQPALEVLPDDFSKVMKVNLDGAFYTAQAAGKIFKNQGHGSVIFTASVSAILVNVPQQQAAYNASKAAVLHLAKSLAVEWADFAKVNVVSPGFVATDMLDIHPKEWRDTWLNMIPGGRVCDPYELKGAYVFLASDASSYMTGANIVIDGGYTLP